MEAKPFGCGITHPLQRHGLWKKKEIGGRGANERLES